MAPHTTDSVLLTGRHKFLNFYMVDMVIPHPVTSADTVWPSVEHYFQACKGLFVMGGSAMSKHAQTNTVDLINQAVSPSDAKQMGRKIDIHLPLWNRASFAFMLQGHIAKFAQNADLQAELVATGNKRLVEHRKDPLWGDNMDNSGKNLCGRSLMVVRRMARDWQPNA